jgi:hypothetical protein
LWRVASAAGRAGPGQGSDNLNECRGRVGDRACTGFRSKRDDTAARNGHCRPGTSCSDLPNGFWFGITGR